MKPLWSTAGNFWRSTEISVDAGACISAAARLLLFPLPWVGASYLAAAVHELGHLTLLWVCGIPVWRIRIGAFGAKLETAPLDPRQELVCALAGPAFGLLLCLFFRLLPHTAVWAGAQTLYNLLPFAPMDGGRALRCWLILRANPRADGKISCKSGRFGVQ